MLTHLRSTIRVLLKSPGFTITTVLILALGIGANTAIFSLIDTVLMKPLPYPQADRLVEIFQPLRNITTFHVAYPDYEDFCANQHSFRELALIFSDDLNLTGQGDPVHVSAAFVTGNLFKTLGRPFVLGRPFDEKEGRPDGPAVVILSERLWRSRFHADPGVLGTRLILSANSYQIIGVTSQRADETADVYAPLHLEPALQQLKTDRASHDFQCVGRLKDGVALQQAQADLEVTSRNLAAQFPETHAAITVRVVPLVESVVGDYGSTLWLLGGSVTLLLLLACVNVGGLHVARALERRKEMTIRASLGASRGQLVWQLMSESAVLSLFGGVIGFVFAHWAIRIVKVLSPQGAPRLDEFGFDALAFFLVLLLTYLMSLLAGWFPGVALAKVDLAAALKSEGTFGGTGGPRRRRIHSGLIVCQVALAALLLFGCGLLARSFQTLQNVPLGFNPNHVLSANIYLVDTKYPDEAACKAFFDAVIDKVRQIPGVKAVGTTDVLPFSTDDDHYNTGPFAIGGQPDPGQGHRQRAKLQVVSPDYFHALEIPLWKGRGFTKEDQLNKGRVVIVNRTLAESYFPGQDPIGKQIHDFGEIEGLPRTNYTIVGVVRSICQVNPAMRQTLFQCYFPYGQQHPYITHQDSFCTLVVRVDGDPKLLIPTVQKIVSSVDQDVPFSEPGAFASIIDKTFQTRWLTLLLVTLFSFFALTLSAVGLYGVLARLVSLRIRDIGIRIALGARVVHIIRLVFWHGFRIVLVGLALGIVAGLILGQFLTGILYGTSSSDPVAVGLVALVLAVAAFLACLIPTLRATRIDPIRALRE
jgi:putative ABC transport system permease protein